MTLDPSDPDGLTLAVMARAPVAGRCKTRLGKVIGLEDAARLYGAMLADTLAALSTIPARHVILAAPEDDGVAMLGRLAPPGWTVTPQRGPDLGARLACGMADLWRDGGLVCLLDSDSPTVPIRAIAARLADRACRAPRTVVAGPCDDGGYYLIGATVLEPRIFQGIPWSTSAVMAATRGRCIDLDLAIQELPRGYDVDGPEDLARLGAELDGRPDLAPRTAAVLRALAANGAART